MEPPALFPGLFCLQFSITYCVNLEAEEKSGNEALRAAVNLLVAELLTQGVISAILIPRV